MNEDQIKMLKRTIIAASNYYGKELSDDAVRMYANDLSEFGYLPVMDAITKYRRDSRNRQMFLPAHIVEIIQPRIHDKDLAVVTANKVHEAVVKFGHMRQQEARENIGEQGWRIIQRMGGWVWLCENLGVDISVTTFTAQFRDTMNSELALQSAGVNTSLPVIEQARELKQIGTIIKLPEGPGGK